MNFQVISPATRSVLLAVIFGMMSAAYLHDRGIVDLSYGFAQGGIREGALMALTGGAGGYALLYIFRTLRNFMRGARKE
jgi:hypothetical protein